MKPRKWDFVGTNCCLVSDRPKPVVLQISSIINEGDIELLIISHCLICTKIFWFPIYTDSIAKGLLKADL